MYFICMQSELSIQVILLQQFFLLKCVINKYNMH